MSREIKFRGLGVISNKWHYGSYAKTSYASTGHIIIGHSGLGHVEITSESRGQFIGLKDKNGVDCYEGDIVKITYESCTGSISYYPPKVVSWSIDACKFNISCGVDFEIIGNIHQSSNLMS